MNAEGLPAISHDPSVPRDERLQQIIDHAARTIAQGGWVDFAALTSQHAELMPEIEQQLRLLELTRKELLAAQSVDRPLHGVRSSAEIAVPGYTLGELIGAGGQGAVFRATRDSDRVAVAIKILFGGPLLTRQREARLKREVAILSSLKHRNIVSVLDHGRTVDGSLFIVMTLVEGTDLDSWIEGCRHRLTDRTEYLHAVVKLFARVIAAVAAAHAANVVHRDLKPSNIRVDSHGEPFLLDFGLARVLEGSDESSRRVSVTGEGSVMGSLPWFSPEQADGDTRNVGAPSDVYSLAVMLYEALTHQPPYPLPKSIVDSLLSIRQTVPPPASSVSDTPRRLSDVLVKAMEKSPANRYADAGQFLAAFQASADDIGRASAGSNGRRRLVLASVALASIVALAGLVLPRLWKDSPNGSPSGVTPVAATLPTKRIELTSTKDAFVRNGPHSSTPFGAERANPSNTFETLEVKRVPEPGYARDAYIEFELRELPAGGQVQRATLHLVGRAVVGKKSVSTEFEGVSVSAFGLQNPELVWEEQEITWDNRPLLKGWSSVQTALSTQMVMTDTERSYSFDVTSLVQRAVQEHRQAITVGLHIVDYRDVHAAFRSSETSNPPRLELEVHPSP